MRESIIKSALLSLFSGWVSFAVSMVTNIILARVVGPETKGILTIFSATLGILALPGFAVQLGIVHFIAGRRPDWVKFRGLLDATAFIQSVVLVSVLYATIQVPAVRRVVFAGLDGFYLFPMLLALISVLVFMYRSSLLTGLGLPGRGAVWGSISSLAQSGILLVPLVWWWWTGATPEVGSVVIASAAATALASAIWLIPTTRMRIADASPVRLREAAVSIGFFAAPVLARSVLEWINRRMDVYFVQALAGPQQLGLYTVAVGLAQQSWMIPFAVTTPIFARVSATGDTARSRELTQLAFRVTAVISLGLGLAMALAMPAVLPLAYGARFEGSVPLLLLLLPGVVMIGPTRTLSAYFTATGRTREPLHAELIAGVVTVALLVWLVSPFGGAGAALASSAAYGVYAWFICARFVRISEGQWSDLLRFQRSDWTHLLARADPGARLGYLMRRFSSRLARRSGTG